MVRIKRWIQICVSESQENGQQQWKTHSQPQDKRRNIKAREQNKPLRLCHVIKNKKKKG
jgi:hypothetical protein